MNANMGPEINNVDAVDLHMKGKSGAGRAFSQNTLDRFSLLKCCGVSSSLYSSLWVRLQQR
jgi:hypothetical protein